MPISTSSFGDDRDGRYAEYEAKLKRSQDDLEQLSAWLTPRECMALLADRDYFDRGSAPAADSRTPEQP